MGFRIKGDDTIGGAFRRLARKETGRALRALLDEQRSPTDRVHDMRTSIKRVRALTDIARPSARREADRVDQGLRKVARAASAFRDGDVSLSTFDSLLPSLTAAHAAATATANPTANANANAFRRTRGHLAARLRLAATQFEEGGRVHSLARQLRRVRKRTKRWIPRRKGWRQLREGLFEGYRRARRAMKHAYAKNTGRVFHEWRRAVKAHRYQLQLVEGLWPGEATAHVEGLERLGQLLGEEHDLSVLAETVLADPAYLSGAADRARLLGIVEQRQQTLRAEARPLGQRLFAERPRAFRRRLKDELGRGAVPAAQVEPSAATA